MNNSDDIPEIGSAWVHKLNPFRVVVVDYVGQQPKGSVTYVGFHGKAFSECPPLKRFRRWYRLAAHSRGI